MKMFVTVGSSPILVEIAVRAVAREAGRDVILHKENLKRNYKYLHRVFKDAWGHNWCLLITGAGLSSSCWQISHLYCLWVLFFHGASSYSSSSLSLLYFSKICPVPLKSLSTTGLGRRSTSNHLSRLFPWRSHWPGKSSGAGGSGAGVLSLGSLSSERAEICVMWVKEGYRLPNWRVWAMVWEGLCGNR